MWDTHIDCFVLAFIAFLTKGELFIWDFELKQDLLSTFWSSERQLKMYFRVVPHFFLKFIIARSLTIVKPANNNHRNLRFLTSSEL